MAALAEERVATQRRRSAATAIKREDNQAAPWTTVDGEPPTHDALLGELVGRARADRRQWQTKFEARMALADQWLEATAFK